MGNFKVAFKGLNVVPRGGKEVVGRCDKVWGRGVEQVLKKLPKNVAVGSKSKIQL